MEIFYNLHRETINIIQQVLESINALIHGFKSSHDILLPGHNMGLCISGNVPSWEHPHRYNRSIVSEVAAIVLDEQHLNCGKDIILYQHGTDLLQIRETHSTYDAISYPFLFLEG